MTGAKWAICPDLRRGGRDAEARGGQRVWRKRAERDGQRGTDERGAGTGKRGYGRAARGYSGGW